MDSFNSPTRTLENRTLYVVEKCMPEQAAPGNRNIKKTVHFLFGLIKMQASCFSGNSEIRTVSQGGLFFGSVC